MNNISWGLIQANIMFSGFMNEYSRMATQKVKDKRCSNYCLGKNFGLVTALPSKYLKCSCVVRKKKTIKNEKNGSQRVVYILYL